MFYLLFEDKNQKQNKIIQNVTRQIKKHFKHKKKSHEKFGENNNTKHFTRRVTAQ